MASIKRVMGRYRVVYDRPDDVEGVRTFSSESAAQDFVSGLGERVPDTERNTSSGDPQQTGSQDSLDRLAADAADTDPEPGERTDDGSIQTNAGFSVRPVEGGDQDRDTETMTENTAAQQARRLLSGAGGGGPTGGATDGVDPSSGSIPGTPESVLPSNFGAGSSDGNMPRDDASDPTRRNVSTTDIEGAAVNIRDVGVVVLVAGVVLWVVDQVMG